MMANNKAVHLLFEAVTRCAELFLGMRWPKTIRIVLSAALVIAQTSSLATRSAQIVALITRAELLTWNLPNARSSLLGLQHMLDLGTGGNSTVTSIAGNRATAKESDVKVDSNILVPVMLDADVANKSPLASPTLREQPFKQPAFFGHKKECNCSVCTNPAIQKNILDTLFMQAHLFELSGKSKQAANFYDGALRLKDFVEKKETRLNANVSKDIEMLLKIEGNPKFDAFSQSCFGMSTQLIYVYYADFLACHYKYDMALEYNEKLVRNRVHDSQLHLMQEAMEQKFALFKAVTICKTKGSNKENRLPVNEADENESFYDVKTPTVGKSERKCFNVPQSTYGSNLKEDIWFYANRKQVVPSFAFNLSSSDEGSPNHNKDPKLKRLKSKRLNLATPSLTNGKKLQSLKVQHNHASKSVTRTPKIHMQSTNSKMVFSCTTPKTGKKLSHEVESIFSPLFDIGNIELVDDVFATPQQILPSAVKTGTTSTVVRRTKKKIFSSSSDSADQEHRQAVYDVNSPLTVIKGAQFTRKKLPMSDAVIDNNCLKELNKLPNNSDKNVKEIRLKKGASTTSKSKVSNYIQKEDSCKKATLQKKVIPITAKSKAPVLTNERGCVLDITLDSSFELFPPRYRGRQISATKSSENTVKLVKTPPATIVISDDTVTSDMSIIESSYDPVLSARRARGARKVVEVKANKQSRNLMKESRQVVTSSVEMECPSSLCKNKLVSNQSKVKTNEHGSSKPLVSGHSKDAAVRVRKPLLLPDHSAVKQKQSVTKSLTREKSKNTDKLSTSSSDSPSGAILKTSAIKSLRSRNEPEGVAHSSSPDRSTRRKNPATQTVAEKLTLGSKVVPVTKNESAARKVPMRQRLVAHSFDLHDSTRPKTRNRKAD